LILALLATMAASGACRPIAPPASALAQRRGAARDAATDGRIKPGEPARLVPRPVVRRIGIDEGACGWQVYCL
jgi:hypothetical protein